MATSTLIPTGHVCVYPGQRKIFTCQVTYNNVTNISSKQLQWRVHFHNSANRNNITGNFLQSDQVGHIIENQRMFAFNLTLNEMYSLESTMTLTVSRNSTFISNTVITCQDCNLEADEKVVLHLQINGKTLLE